MLGTREEMAMMQNVKRASDAEVERVVDEWLQMSDPRYWACQVASFWMNFASQMAVQAGMARMT